MNRLTPQKGLTLVELMTVVAVLGIVLAVAAPSLADMVERRRVEMVASELSTDLAYARSEAGMRNEKVTLHFKSTDAMSCYTIAVHVGSGSCDCTLPPGSACSDSQRELKTTQINRVQGVKMLTDAQIYGRRGANAVQFQEGTLSVTPVGGGVITVTTTEGRALRKLHVRVGALGSAVVCAPDNTMSGVKPC